jgi:hypothetical protein
MTNKRPHVALGGRILTAGIAAGGTLGLTTLMQQKANAVDAQFVNVTTTTSTPASTAPQVVVIPVDGQTATTQAGVTQVTTPQRIVNGKPVAVPTTIKPATPPKQGATTTTQFSTGLPPTTTAAVAPTTTQAPAPTTTATSCTAIKHAKGWC